MQVKNNSYLSQQVPVAPYWQRVNGCLEPSEEAPCIHVATGVPMLCFLQQDQVNKLNISAFCSNMTLLETETIFGV